MSSVKSDIVALKKTLEPYIKQRDEVAYIRRTLALYLQDSIDGPELESPVSLVDESSQVNIPSDLMGLRRQYLQALETNLKATLAFQNVRSQLSKPPLTEPARVLGNTDIVCEKLGLIKSKQKEEKLKKVTQYLDEMSGKPAAQPGFLDPVDILNGSVPLPEIPEEVIVGIVDECRVYGDDSTISQNELNELRKQTIKTKALLKQEEKRLEAARKSLPIDSKQIAETRKRYALNATRNELIKWIETELSKASQDTAVNEPTKSPKTNKIPSIEEIAALTQGAKHNYTEYNEYRQALLNIIESVPKIDAEFLPTPLEPQRGADIPKTDSIAHLMTPYLNKLFTLSREQRGIISHKAHINSSFSKQDKESCQVLDHLAEESQLLISYGTDKYHEGVDEEAPAPSTRVLEWSYSAEAAKISNMEAVAEKMEVGQVALETTQAVLVEIQGAIDPESGQDQCEADDNGVGAKENCHIWKRINGKLGLIGQ
ncbi:hypothetical protein CFIMG_008436RA00001 [Ceratocystis fimbriata CBS 114723]|uniref:Uncharacterized protein n=1 Tax=Ceratocystis fimbriata CBS 114723 TaxID=1035309 RepID=A0A2C5XHP7_9PEZI|nr:hypothetical protein CFIMG_008436RA00001 [Ceratocystis fimbriata CBS 114723]